MSEELSAEPEIVQKRHAPPNLSRRRFLFTSTKAAVAVGIGVKSLTWLTGCASETAPNPTGIWVELDAALTGELFLPGSMGYFDKAKPWALQYVGTLPAGIARCANEQDVQTCVTWAKKNKVVLVARSGGHSYAAYSTTEGLLVDVSAMNTVTFDAASGMAAVAGGARNKDVYAALRPVGMAVTHGRCKEVGVAGLVLGGGIGFNMRARGLTCDRLRSTRIVTSDGLVRVCSETENTDLFWAIRGAGGGNFGIHTAFTFEPFVAPSITVFDITWDDNPEAVFEESIEAVFTALQDIVIAAPSTLGIKVSVGAKPVGASTKITVRILGQLVGSVSDLTALIQPAINIAAPTSSDIQVMAYWDGQEFLSEEGYPEYSHERSRFAPSAISTDGIAAIFRNMRAWPTTSGAATWKFFLMGGEIASKSPSDTSFVHRSSAMITSLELEWLPADDGAVLQTSMAWLDAFHDEMQSYTSAHCYQNFIDRRQTNYLDAYYGENFDRLKQVKLAVDPTNMFTYPQAIPVG